MEGRGREEEGGEGRAGEGKGGKGKSPTTLGSADLTHPTDTTTEPLSLAM